jgi:hypothetical protein
MSTGATAALIPYCDQLHYTRIVELKFQSPVFTYKDVIFE